MKGSVNQTKTIFKQNKNPIFSPANFEYLNSIIFSKMSENDESFEQGDEEVSKANSLDLAVQKQFPENFERQFLSEAMILIDKPYDARKIFSDPNLGYEVNYDDLCGPWSCPENPAYRSYDVPIVPQICTWLFVDEADMFHLKQYRNNKDAILNLIGSKLPNNVIFGGTNKDIFLQLIWEVFRFSRNNGYTEISTSSLLGLFYITHRYFLTTLWRTAAETYEFFKEGILLHSVTHPPKSTEVFTPKQSKQLLDLFSTLYMRQLPLLRLVCLPNYRLIMKLDKSSPEFEEKDFKK